MSTALLVFLLCAPAKPAGGVDVAVVCPQEFRQALEPWIKHRRAQGHRVAVLSNMQSAEELRQDIRRVAQGGSLRYLVLVGDADPAMSKNEQVRKRCIPTHHARAVVNVKFGSAPEIATDNWYADLDDDHVPELAVGRLTADTPAEVALLVRKILDYEKSRDYGPWRRQVHFVAGLGGFGPVADTVLESAAKSLISEGIPAAFCTTMTYGSWQSPYCPDPREFQRVTLGRLNEGSLFWVYIGHGQQRSVDQVRVPGGNYPILSCADTPDLACAHGATIACFLACHSGAFDQPRDCLAEDLLRSPGGPVAIISGSRVTMPYAMSVMGSELLQQCFAERAETLGDAILAAKRRMIKTDNPSRHRKALDAVARTLSPTAGELDAERTEHLHLFNLIGDPLLRIPHPQSLEVAVSSTAAPGETLQITGVSPLAGEAVVELAVRRDRLTFQPPKRGKYDPASLESFTEIYQKANEPRLASVKLTVSEGNFATALQVPETAKGPCHVRVFVEGQQACAVGAADLKIEPPAER